MREVRGEWLCIMFSCFHPAQFDDEVGSQHEHEQAGPSKGLEARCASGASDLFGCGMRDADCELRAAGCSNGGELLRMESLAHERTSTGNALSIAIVREPLPWPCHCLSGEVQDPLFVVACTYSRYQDGRRSGPWYLANPGGTFVYTVQYLGGHLRYSFWRAKGGALSAQSTSNLADCCISYRLVGWTKQPAPNSSVLLIESCQAIASTCVLGLIGSHTFMFDELSCISFPTPCLLEPLTYHRAPISFFNPHCNPPQMVPFALATVGQHVSVAGMQADLEGNGPYMLSTLTGEHSR
ncbi:hypothetical protein F5Y07DRAFT_272699 [Xylaria sp. FL0933]|nr:hypothetical protein F5Y07DRAFT_272699 [Xylaria sp. FL0933]